MNDYLLGILIRERQQQFLKESGRIVPEAENGPGTVERIARRLLRGIAGLKTVAGHPSPPAGPGGIRGRLLKPLHGRSRGMCSLSRFIERPAD